MCNTRGAPHGTGHGAAQGGAGAVPPQEHHARLLRHAPAVLCAGAPREEHHARLLRHAPAVLRAGAPREGKRFRSGRGRPVLPAAQRGASCPVDHPCR
eukprot:2610902-Pyramimonas_sp.AAC.1